MEAKKAKQIAETFNTKNIAGQYERVIGTIKKAAGRGEYNTVIYEGLLNDVRRKLELDGYTVSNNLYERGDVYVEISWNN